MNERIRELADRAELTIRTSKGTYMSHPEFNKKFAELLIREASHALTTRDCRAEPIEHIFILKHFGIEP